MPRLCYCIQIKLTSSVRNRDDPCFLLVKQVVALVSFPAWVWRVASVLCFGKPRGLVRVSPMALVWKHVIYLEAAAWRHRGAVLESRLLMLLVPRCYGFGTVLDFFRWLVSRRASSGPASRSTLRALEGEARESRSTRRRERARWRVVLNSPIWTPPTGGWSNQSVCMGRSPTHVHGFYPRYTFSCDEK